MIAPVNLDIGMLVADITAAWLASERFKAPIGVRLAATAVHGFVQWQTGTT